MMPTYHPSALLRDASKKRDAWEDMQSLRDKLMELGLYPDIYQAEEGCTPWMPWRSFGRKCAAFLNPLWPAEEKPLVFGKATGNRRQ